MPRRESHQIENRSGPVTKFNLSSMWWGRSHCTATAFCARCARQPWVSSATCRYPLSTLRPSTSPRHTLSSLDSLVASPRYNPRASHERRAQSEPHPIPTFSARATSCPPWKQTLPFRRKPYRTLASPVKLRRISRCAAEEIHIAARMSGPGTDRLMALPGLLNMSVQCDWPGHRRLAWPSSSKRNFGGMSR